MKKYLLAATAAICLSAGAAQADSYVSILGGPTWSPALAVGAGKAPMETGFNIGARYGYNLDDWGLSNFSVEADGRFGESRFEGGNTGRIQSSSYMGNLVYHLKTDSPFGVYGGAGLGAVNTNFDNGFDHGGSTVLGWQALGGVEYQTSENISLFAEYRYQNAHNANAGLPNIGNTSNDISFGMKLHL